MALLFSRLGGDDDIPPANFPALSELVVGISERRCKDSENPTLTMTQGLTLLAAISRAGTRYLGVDDRQRFA